MLEDLNYDSLTPMMQQWYQCKKSAQTALLLFRMGDFYEAFYEDAKILSSALNLTLTKRGGIPMSGIPWHSSQNYLERLMKEGFKVAIAEQVEDPKEAKGLVRREITEVITPGTTLNNQALDEKKNNFIVGLSELGSFLGLGVLDLSTGTFKTTEIEKFEDLDAEIQKIAPSEIITHKKFFQKHQHWFKTLKVLVTTIDDWLFDHEKAYATLKKHFQVPCLDPFGLKGLVAAINASGGLLAYLQDYLNLPLKNLKAIEPYTIQDFLILDKATQQHLDLFEGKTSLIRFLDHTLTPMGARLLKNWLQYPLLNEEEISKRYDAIEQIGNLKDKDRCCELLQEVKDLERLVIRITSKQSYAKDVVALKTSLKVIPELKQLFSQHDVTLLHKALDQLTPLKELTDLLDQALVDEPPLRINEPGTFKTGFDPLLDEYQQLSEGSQQWIANYQSELRDKLQIKTLKVSFNKVFGYYIEVSKGQAHLMPPQFVKKQTLVNNERFISDELKVYEDKVLSAREKMIALEAELFDKIRHTIFEHLDTILKNAESIAILDAILSLHQVALRFDFTRPCLNESKKLIIEEARHPIVQAHLKEGLFIPNDVQLDESSSLMLITGPNMAGKSTYIRSVAIICLLAQMGSFVPAKKAELGLMDRIFTRIGASDDLASGQSTFMVEMTETANILKHASNRSLVILDEIGRGTSTYDGVAIAWSVCEYLVRKGCAPLTLFATHYFELTKLEQKFSCVVNYHAVCQEHHHEIIFLHKIAKGKADRSYGIHVAKLAGLPLTVVARAEEILKDLSVNEQKKSKRKTANHQLTFV